MQLSKEQHEIVELKKWAYQMAMNIAEKNASHLTKASERSRIDGKKVQEHAEELFRWVTTTKSA